MAREQRSRRRKGTASDEIITMNHVSKAYATGAPALNGVDLHIKKGEFVFIVGDSGAGKSTMIKLLLRELVPTEGEINVMGYDLVRIRHRKIPMFRRNLGIVFQDFRLLKDRNVYENVAFAQRIIQKPTKEIKRNVPSILATVGLAGKYKAKPRQLSGGEQQRVAIARALANNPKILLCDEATSALDPTTTKAILALLKEINEKYGITIVIITHEMAVVQEICTHVAIVDSGNLAETGTVEEVFSRPKSSAARKLVFQDENGKYEEMTGKRCIRIVFKSNSSFEPVIANMVLACKAPVNILLADTKDIGGVAHGQMILQLPDEAVAAEKMIQYLRDRNLEVEELKNYVG